MGELESLKRILERERAARKESERILEEKSLELYHANKELKKLYNSLEHKYEKIIEQADDIIYTGDEKGRCVYVNNVATKILGYSQEELIGKHFTELVTENRLEEVVAFYNRQLKYKLENTYLEFTVKAKNGKSIWLGQNVSLLIEDDQVTGISAVARDITNQKQAEELVRLNEKKYREVIENMQLGLLEVDIDGKVVSSNSIFEKITGYKQNELIGKDPAKLLTDSKSKKIIDKKNDDRKRGESSVYEVLCKGKDGKPLWLMISGAPRYNKENEFIGSIGIHMDITEQKKLLSQLEKAKTTAEDSSKAKETFLAHMSHEIRTPLNSVIGMTHLLQETITTDEQKDYLETIQYSSEMLMNIISDILDFSKIEAGKIELNEVVFDVVEMLHAIQKTFSYRLKDKEVELELFIDPTINYQILGDRILVNQILMNLVSNASKFTSKGFIRIYLQKVKEVGDKVTLKFKVEDTGIGIKPRKVNQVFESFKQLNTDSSIIYEGTGLGLTIVKHLVDLQKGKISVESEVNVGTTFSIEIPFIKTDVQLNRKNLEKEAKTALSLNGVKVLVAEDNLMNQKFLSKVLDKVHINYTICENGKECLQIAQEEVFDMILMDIQMPILDGYSTAKMIRKLDHKNSAIPIVALTASALVNERKKVLEAGMNEHLSKPYTPEELIQCIERYVGPSSSKEIKIDPSTLNELYGDDIEFKKEMFELFLKNTNVELERLQQAVENKDHEVVYQVAHKIKPTIKMVGLEENIHELIKKIESLAKEEDTSYSLLVDELTKLFPQIKGIVEEELKKTAVS